MSFLVREVISVSRDGSVESLMRFGLHDCSVRASKRDNDEDTVFQTYDTSAIQHFSKAGKERAQSGLELNELSGPPIMNNRTSSCECQTVFLQY